MSLHAVALIGNPNCGKTTLFNALTGTHQRVGNWPGVTVEKKSGEFSVDGVKLELVDLPGIYSLEQTYLGLDEQIAKDYLDADEAKCIVNIIDASNIERNLVLTQQLLEQNINVIVALNMLDVAKQQGTVVDAVKLSEKLGVPVVPIIASTGQGVPELRQLMSDRIDVVAEKKPALADDFANVSEKLVRRYHTSRVLVDGVVEVTPMTHTLTEQIDRWVLNKWLGIPCFLLMMYLMFTVAINMGAVFIDFFDILFGAIFVDGSTALLEQLGTPQWMIVILANGLGGGIQLVATFIPVIGFLFFCLSILEDSGYMSRAAFVVDRLMSRIGLPGTAFVPLIVGFGCNVPAVMASRTLGRDSDRLLAISMAPFMSCGARLTVYALFAAAFFPKNGQNIVFALYLMGIAMAVLTGFIFRKQIFREEMTPSFQEMPAYHIPVLRNLLLTTWMRLRSFVMRAGKTIVLVVIGLSFLNSYGLDGSFGNEDSEASALSVVGKAITPIFAPIGIKEDNWPATVGLFTGIFAKEAVVGTLDALYSDPVNDGEQLGLLAATEAAFVSVWDNAQDLAGALTDPLGISLGDLSDSAGAAADQGVTTTTLSNMAQAFGTQYAAFCYLVFVLLYAPCVAVLGATAKEAGWRWMVLIFTWTTFVAYATSSVLFQLSRIGEAPVFAVSWIIMTALVATVFILSLKRIGQRALPSNLIQTVQVT
ncbi:MAG: ferrous iron transport protein B [Candidatus Azotimanducaceae bacterium]|jgi:ferrous iron transport protein B